MSRRLQYGLSVVIAIVLLYQIGAHPLYAAFSMLALAVLIPGALKLDSWLCERRQRRRLAFDAEYQHAAWMAGDDRTAFFGRYQPPSEMYVPKTQRADGPP
jgi:hypothetical protein